MSYRIDCVYYKEEWKEVSAPHYSSEPKRECGAEVEDFEKGYCPEDCTRFLHNEDIKLQKSEL